MTFVIPIQRVRGKTGEAAGAFSEGRQELDCITVPLKLEARHTPAI